MVGGHSERQDNVSKKDYGEDKAISRYVTPRVGMACKRQSRTLLSDLAIVPHV